MIEIPTRGGTIESDNMTGNHSGACGKAAGAGSAPRLVERKTALRGQDIAPGRTAAGTIRKNTLCDLREKNPEVPYVKFETALSDLVCSLMERQDRMNEEILRRMIDLQYRMDDIEADLPGGRGRS